MTSNTNNSSTKANATNNNNEGINIHDAMAILSGRSTKGSELKQMQIAGENDQVTEEKKRVGQQIDLFEQTQEWTKTDSHQGCIACDDKVSTGTTTNGSSETAVGSENLTPLQQTQSELASKTESHRLQLREELSSATYLDLLQLITKVQQDRVSTYKIFDQALQTVLKTGGNVSTYPAAVAETTASFSVLSNTMNAVLDIFISRDQEVRSNNCSKEKKRHIKDCITWVKTLQQKEREKLNLTAALHLEKIRQVNSSNMDEVEDSKGRMSSSTLLRRGIQSMQQQLAPIIEEINDVLEEIRYAITEAKST